MDKFHTPNLINIAKILAYQIHDFNKNLFFGEVIRPKEALNCSHSSLSYFAEGIRERQRNDANMQDTIFQRIIWN